MTEAYPLKWPAGWPKKTGYMAGGPFKGLTPEKALNSLKRELKLLGAQNVVVSSNLRPRNYVGDVRTNAQTSPGVALYFTLKARPMVMAQDVYTSAWANMRSLALAIEGMRQIERHGGGHMMERAFDGFAQLPPPAGSTAPAKRPWREVLELEGFSGPAFAVLAGAEASYKTLARKRHPDAPGGSHDAMSELNMAIEDARAECR